MSETSAPKVARCPYCGTVGCHPVTMCHLVKAIEYHPDGTIKRVELVR